MTATKRNVAKPATHTPGPWHIVDREFGHAVFTDEQHNPMRDGPNGCTIGSVATVVGMGDADPANATLIASAPELLAALQRLLAEADDDGITQDGVDAALAAIAKATGGTQ